MYNPMHLTSAIIAPSVCFDQCKHDSVLAKLAEFNALLAADSATQRLALSEPDMATLGDLMRALKSMGERAPISAAQLALFVGGGNRSSELLRWPPAQLFPALDVLRLVVLAPAVAPLLSSLDPPLIPRLVALIPDAATADKPLQAVSLMVHRCFANLAHNKATCKLFMASASEVLDTLATAIETGNSPLRLAACTVLLNTCSLLKDAMMEKTAIKADALQLQTLSLCAHALSSVEQMALASEEEALYRLLTSLETLIGLGASTHSLALDLDIPTALQALPLADTAPAKVKESRARLLTKLSAATSKQ